MIEYYNKLEKLGFIIKDVIVAQGVSEFYITFKDFYCKNPKTAIRSYKTFVNKQINKLQKEKEKLDKEISEYLEMLNKVNNE